MVEYLHIAEGFELPELGAEGPFRAVVVLEQAINAERRTNIAEWIVKNGCLYAIAWGEECEAMHDEIDWALVRNFDGVEIPDEQFMMTTWHDDEPLSEVMSFAKLCAVHPHVEVRSTVIIHLSPSPARQAMLEAYRVS